MVWTVWMLAFGGGAHTEASKAALRTWLGPGEHPNALVEARREADAALSSSEADDAETWVHAVRVFGHAGTTGSGDVAAVDALLRSSRTAVERGADAERVAREVQKVSLKLTRLSMNAMLAGRRGGGESAAIQAYAWAQKALELDELSESLGFPIPAQHASTLSVAASTAVDAKRIDEAFAHYDALRAMGQKDIGIARQLARQKAKDQGVDSALAWLQADLAQEREDVALIELSADLLLDAGRPEDALAAVEPYMAVFEGSGDAWAVFGRVQAAAGLLDDARASLDRCLALTPDDVACLWGRARIPYAAGRAIPLVVVTGRKAKKTEGYMERRAFMKEALFYLERARKLETNDLRVNAALLSIYTEFDDKEGIEALSP